MELQKLPIGRLKLDTLYPMLFAVIKPTVAKTQILRWSTVAKHQDQAVFLRAHRADCCLLLPSASVDEVMHY